MKTVGSEGSFRLMGRISIGEVICSLRDRHSVRVLIVMLANTAASAVYRIIFESPEINQSTGL